MKSMREQSIDLMQAVLNDWKKERKYTYESKKLYVNPNPTMHGELILHVSNSVDSFIKDGQLIDTFLLSPYFGTATLSAHPLSQNPAGDSHRLKDFLKKFDEEFYALVEEKISVAGVQTSDPLFW